MQPWKISIGCTAVVLAAGIMLAGDAFIYLKPHLRTIATDHWKPVAWFGGLAVACIAMSIYDAARALGLTDMGRKVDLMERSLRRGEQGQTELAAKLESEEQGKYPGS